MNPQMLQTIAVAALATATVGLALWVCLPSFLPGIGLAFYECGGDPDDKLADTEDDPQYHDLRGQLLELGFTAVGSAWEETIDRPRGNGTSVLSHAEHGCYAGIWRLSGGDYRAYITTVFSDGAAVMTANYSRPQELTADYHAAGTPTQTMTVLLAEHRAAVADFVKQGHAVQRSTTLDDILKAKKVYFHNPSVQRTYRANKFKVFWHRFKEMAVYPGIITGLLLFLGLGPLYSWGAGFFTAAFIGVYVRGIEFKNLMSGHLQEKSAEQQQADLKREGKKRF